MFDITVLILILQFTNNLNILKFILFIIKKTSSMSEILYEENSAASLNNYKLQIKNQHLLFSSLSGLNLESIKILISSNTDLIQSFIEKCRAATPPLYSGQPRDLKRENRCKQFIDTPFVAIAIAPDGNCLYRSISMCLFGNQDYHVQMRLATIYFVLKFEAYFQELLCQTEGKFDSNWQPIQHIDKFISSIATNAWGCNVVMVALSMLVNRPICYLNAYDQQPNNNSVPEDSDIHILSSEVTVEPRFRIAYAFESQLKKISPLSIMLYDQHYVSLVSTIHNATVFDFNSICFFNSFNLLDNELFI
jgi:hypothetical protein